MKPARPRTPDEDYRFRRPFFAADFRALLRTAAFDFGAVFCFFRDPALLRADFFAAVRLVAAARFAVRPAVRPAAFAARCAVFGRAERPGLRRLPEPRADEMAASAAAPPTRPAARAPRSTARAAVPPARDPAREALPLRPAAVPLLRVAERLAPAPRADAAARERFVAAAADEAVSDAASPTADAACCVPLAAVDAVRVAAPVTIDATFVAACAASPATFPAVCAVLTTARVTLPIAVPTTSAARVTGSLLSSLSSAIAHSFGSRYPYRRPRFHFTATRRLRRLAHGGRYR